MKNPLIEGLIRFGRHPWNPRGKYRLYKILTAVFKEFEATTPQGVRLIFRPDDVTAYYFFRHDYEPQLAALIQALPADGVFVDVGANMGNFSMLAARQVGPRGLVVACEPVAETFSRLLRHIDRNQITNLVPVNLAVSSAPGIVSMAVSDNSGLSHISGDAPAEGRVSQKVAAVTLDQLLPPLLENRPVDLLKLDVEGAEAGVLRGAVDLLAAGVIRCVHVEISAEHLARFGDSVADIEDLLRAHGYAGTLAAEGRPIYDQIFVQG